MACHADRCIAEMDALGLDITQLFALRHWDWLDSIESMREIKSFAEKLGVNMAIGTSKEFQERVSRVFRARGIVDLEPDRRVEAYYKNELFGKYQAAQWPRPHTPYLLQMRPGLYILLSNYQAGFHLIKRMACDRAYRARDGARIPMHLLYEGQMEGVPCRIILDCDSYVAQFKPGTTEQQLVDTMRRIPETLVQRLVAIGALQGDQTVTFYEKNKSRPGKVSFHFTTSIWIDPTVDGKHVLRQVIGQPLEEVHRVCKATKSMAHSQTCADGMCDPLALIDPVTIKGKHQFSVVFSRKDGEQPCVIERRIDVSDGGRTVRATRSAWADQPHVPTHAHALEMLYYGGFTHWVATNPVTIHKQFRIIPDALALGPRVGFGGFILIITRRETRTHAHAWRGRKKNWRRGASPAVASLVPVAIMGPAEKTAPPLCRHG